MITAMHCNKSYQRVSAVKLKRNINLLLLIFLHNDLNIYIPIKLHGPEICTNVYNIFFI